jgi:hypothetical protein
MIFMASLFGAPCPKKEQKFFCGPAFGASLFKLWGLTFFILELRFWGPWILWGPALFGSRVKTGNKKTFGAPLFGASVFVASPLATM